MSILKRMTINELKNAIWCLVNGQNAMGGLPLENYRQELFLRTGEITGFHNS